MEQESLATKMKRHPTLSFVLMMLSGFCVFVMGGTFVPKVITLLNIIDTHGVSGMGWSGALIMFMASLYGILGFGFYLAFKVCEKIVVDDILTSLPKSKQNNT